MPPQGKVLWKQLAPALKKQGLLTPLRLPVFYGMCLAWGLVCDAAAVLQDEGYTVKGTHGTVKKHPVLTLLHEQLTQFRHYSRQLGIMDGDTEAFTNDELEDILTDEST